MTNTFGARLQLEMQRMAARMCYGMTNYRHPLRRSQWQLTQRIPKTIPTGTTPLECVELCQAVAACEKLPGDMAEAGVYRGGTAAMMLSTSAKQLHLFDTFEGLPHGERKFESGEWAGSLQQVQNSLLPWKDRVAFHPGFFPASAAGLEDLRFSFVHLDLDLYDSTIAALNWFWPRLHPGGILVSHDYPLVDGVVKAFAEFFCGRPEPSIPLSGNQCLAVKLQVN